MKKQASNFVVRHKWAIGIVVAILIFVISPYNSLVSKDEEMNKAWSNVEVQYQRRYDTIPNLVSTVQGYASHEKELFTAITEARSGWRQATEGRARGAQIAAASGMDSALSRLLVTVENYPNLKADAGFLSLQTELAGTENRIAVSRNRFNDAVTSYNKYRRQFPKNLTAMIFGFEKAENFDMLNAEAETPVKVEF